MFSYSIIHLKIFTEKSSKVWVYSNEQNIQIHISLLGEVYNLAEGSKKSQKIYSKFKKAIKAKEKNKARSSKGEEGVNACSWRGVERTVRFQIGWLGKNSLSSTSE